MARVQVRIPEGFAVAEITASEAFIHPAIYSMCSPKLPETWQNPQYARRRRNGWDGRVPFYNWVGGASGFLGVGLVPWVVDQLRKASHLVEIIDERMAVAFGPIPSGLNGMKLWKHQRESLEGIVASRTLGMSGSMAVASICTGGGKTLVTAALCQMLPRGERGLILVPKSGLAHQTARAIADALGKKYVGVFGAGKSQPNHRFVVATVQKIASAIKADAVRATEWLSEFGLLVLDEAHHASGQSADTKDDEDEKFFPEGIFAGVVRRCPAPNRVALSGTPLTKCAIQNWTLTSQFGQQSVVVSYDDLVQAGILARPSFLVVAFPGSYTGQLYHSILEKRITQLENEAWEFPTEQAWKLRGKAQKLRDEQERILGGYNVSAPFVEVHRECIATRPERDAFVAKVTAALVRRGMKTLILVSQLEHGRAQAQACSSCLGEPVDFVSGKMTGKEQDAKFQAFARSGPTALVANKVADEGTDVPDVRAIILGAGGKSYVSTLQRIGRGIRRKAEDNRLLVIDIVDTAHRFLVAHGECRLREYDVAGIRSGAFHLIGTTGPEIEEVEAQIDAWLSREPAGEGGAE